MFEGYRIFFHGGEGVLGVVANQLDGVSLKIFPIMSNPDGYNCKIKKEMAATINPG